MDKIVKMSAAKKFAIPCRSKCRHKDSRIANRQTTRVEVDVLELLDAGSTPAVSIIRFHWISMNVKTLVYQGFFILSMSYSFIEYQTNVVKNVVKA